MTLFKNKYRIESARLPGWDYRNPGYYFVTFCTKNRAPYLGQIIRGEMHLSAIGEIAAQCWAEIPQHHAGVALDEWVIMPNHGHGIIHIVETLHCNVSTTTTTTTPETMETDKMSAISPKTGSLAVVMRSYKSAVTKLAHRAGHEFGWQERFWDRIVRDEAELNRIRNYIQHNPSNWEKDRNNGDGLWM